MTGVMQLRRGKFNPDDVAQLSYFMAFNMPTNQGEADEEEEEEHEGGGRGARPSMIFISQLAEHIHRGLDKDGWERVEGVSGTAGT